MMPPPLYTNSKQMICNGAVECPLQELLLVTRMQWLQQHSQEAPIIDGACGEYKSTAANEIKNHCSSQAALISALEWRVKLDSYSYAVSLQTSTDANVYKGAECVAN